jgi:hypothetical protein
VQRGVDNKSTFKKLALKSTKLHKNKPPLKKYDDNKNPASSYHGTPTAIVSGGRGNKTKNIN